MLVALVGFSIYISLMDLKHHRISNRSLLLGALTFSLLSLIQDYSFFLSSALITLVFAPMVLKAGVGAGDIKLTTVLSIFFLPSNLSTLLHFLSAFVVISSALLLFNIAKEKSLKSSIALAPAICGAVIWCAR